MILRDIETTYAARFISSFVGKSLKPQEVPIQLLELVFREISRQEEVEKPARDQLGNWIWSYNASCLKGTLHHPHVDMAIRRWATDVGLLSSCSYWPENKKFAICITHDVDFISRRSTSLSYVLEAARRVLRCQSRYRASMAKLAVTQAAKFILAPVRKRLSTDEYHCFDTCVENEARYGFNSTFFMFAERIIKPHPVDCGYSYNEKLSYFNKELKVSELMRELLSSSWEVGIHGSYNTAIDSKLLAEEKLILETAIKQPVRATRQHYLHYDVRCTPAVHRDAGIEIDSTQGFNRNIGFRAGTAFPYYAWDHVENRPTDVLEVPMHIMDGPLFAKWALECGVDQAMEYCLSMLDQVEKVNGCLTINWHPSWLSRPLFAEVYKNLLSEAKRRDAWGCGVEKLAQFWRKHLAELETQEPLRANVIVA